MRVVCVGARWMPVLFREECHWDECHWALCPRADRSVPSHGAHRRRTQEVHLKISENINYKGESSIFGDIQIHINVHHTASYEKTRKYENKTAIL